MKSDVGIYVKGEGEEAVYIAPYVDNLFMVGMKFENINVVKQELGRDFNMKDLGETEFLLEIEIRRYENGDVFLVQDKYARDVLTRFNMEGCKPMSTLELGAHLDSSQQPSSDVDMVKMIDIPYMSAIDNLMHLSTSTRPENFALASELSKFSHNSGVAYWVGVKRVLRYIGGTLGEGLMFKRGAQIEMWGYPDSGHAGDKKTSRGQSCYIFFSDGAAISWRSSMMKAVTHNSCESEYVGLSESGDVAVYLIQLQG